MRLSLLLLTGLLALQPTQAQSEHPLTGRHIAPVMGIGGADWLERTEREREEAPEAALDAIGVQKGMTVADVGAGTGYFTIRLAQRVGPTGKVYANDVQPEMLEKIRQRMRKEHLTNIETVAGSVADPKLPANTMDFILLVDVYHEFSQPQVMLQKLRTALKPDGRLILLEYRKEDPTIPIREDHKMTIPEVRTEIEAEGYRMEKVLDTLPRQHLFVFIKR